jgi:transposase InsO family protein
MTLDSGEAIRVIVPESVQLPTQISHSCLLANTPFLMAGHRYINDLYTPKLKLKDAGAYTMSVVKGHHILKILPTDATIETPHRKIYLHNDHPYDPSTFMNNVLYQAINRPSAHTPIAFIYHLRFGCKSIQVLNHTHVDGMQIQQGSWNTLKGQLPCSACIAGKMRKARKNPTKGYTDVENLALSWDPATQNKNVRSNELISLDWGIINEQYVKDANNVFGLFLDNNTGTVFGYPAASTRQAGPTLLAYIQLYGKPHTILTDNAQEFVHDEFTQICLDQGIKQTHNAPYNPNGNPTEHHMEVITSTMRSLLFISRLDPVKFWEHSLTHSITIQNPTVLPGRCTPFEYTFGKRPNVGNLRIFGCEALAFIEKDKRKKLNPKVKKTMYLGMSDTHSDYTYKLLDLTTNKIIYRRNVYFNERSYPARKTKPSKTTVNTLDLGEDLIGLDFIDDGITWTITKIGFENEHIPILYYIDKATQEEERSTVTEVRTWYNRTVLQNAVNQIAPTRKGFINSLAEETFKTVMNYDVKLPHSNVPKPTSFYKASNNPFPQWFQAEDKQRNGMLEFQTWDYLNQKEVTPAIRKRAISR